MSFAIQGLTDRLDKGGSYDHDMMIANHCLWHRWLIVSQLVYIIPALEDYGYDHGGEFELLLESLKESAGLLCDAVFDEIPTRRLFDGIEEPPPDQNTRLGTDKDVMLRMIAARLDSYTAGMLQKDADVSVDILIDAFDQLDDLTDSEKVGDWAKRWRAHIRRLAYQLENVR